MARLSPFLRGAAASSLAASATSVLALAAVARREGRGALQPLNATSHWLNGDGAAAHAGLSLRRTGVGLGTHMAAMLFWAAVFERWTGLRRPLAPAPLLAHAAALSAVAAAVDYGATPRRFTPGWELALSRRGMAVVYAAMAAGMAAGVLLTQARREG